MTINLIGKGIIRELLVKLKDSGFNDGCGCCMSIEASRLPEFWKLAQAIGATDLIGCTVGGCPLCVAKGAPNGCHTENCRCDECLKEVAASSQ